MGQKHGNVLIISFDFQVPAMPDVRQPGCICQFDLNHTIKLSEIEHICDPVLNSNGSDR